ncbi:MAG: aldo/keto reductase, partial [Clostridiales bacterium]|nr:aldo/keto reductase [Clostridiales bacterium]
MEYITLNTGAKMPMLGLGVFRIDDNDGRIAILKAFELGYRSIDTAAAYDNEQVVGEAIAASGIPRDELFITTKLSNTAQRAGDLDGAFAESLKKLGLDYVDLYLMHWPVPETYRDSWLAMEKFHSDGRAKAIGISNFQTYHIEEIKK